MSQLGSDTLIELAFSLVAAGGLIALPVAIILTLAVIYRFRGRVEKSMRAAAGGPTPSFSDTQLPAVQQGKLEIELTEATRQRAMAAQKLPMLRKARRQARWVTGAYTVAACTQSLILAAVLFTETFDVFATWQGKAIWFAMWFLITGTPVFLAAALVLTKRLRFIAIAALFLVVLVPFAPSFGLRDLNAGILGSFAELWYLLAGAPTGFFLLLYARRLRAVGPVVFAATLVLLYGIGVGTFSSVIYGIGEIGPLKFVRQDLTGLSFREAGEIYVAEIYRLPPKEQWARISALAAEPRKVMDAENPDAFERIEVKLWFFVIWLTPSALGLLAALGLVRRIARSYQARRASDQMLTIDVLMVIFSLWMFLALFSAYGWVAAAFVPVGFAAYKGLSLWQLKRRFRSAPAGAPRTLLLLRVFGFDKRTQGLLDRLGRTWRYLGPIRLIGGTDLASTTIEPHEFFEFLNGRLSRAFIKSGEDLDRRLRESRATPDHDGLFRVEDFFCHDDTWRMTVSRLSREADAVLMDLRGFAPTNRGCVLEIEQLLASVPLRHIAFLVDHTTDIPLLEQTVQHAWTIMPASSPNAAPGVHRLRILQASSSIRTTLGALLGLLCEGFDTEAETREHVPIEKPALGIV